MFELGEISPLHFVLAYVSFLTVKTIGYAFAGKALKNAFDETSVSPLKVGVTRTMLGIAIGILYTLVFIAFCDGKPPRDEFHLRAMWHGGLFVFRALEWAAIIWMFYPNALREPKRIVVACLLCAAWSHVLDTPAHWVIRGVFEIPLVTA